MTQFPISKLSKKKYDQLIKSSTNPLTYISIEGYKLDEEQGIVYYKIEVGYQKDNNVVINTVHLRYSQLEKLSKFVNKTFKNDLFVRPFPPKKWLGNTDPYFIEKRMNELQLYLEDLTKTPGITAYPEFKETFNL